MPNINKFHSPIPHTSATKPQPPSTRFQNSNEKLSQKL